MLKKLKNLHAIEETGVILIVRLDDPDEVRSVAEAAIDGGARALEITYSVPGALAIVESLASRHRHEGVVIGVGTALDAHAAYAAVNAGAELLVSPQLNRGMLEIANRYQAVSVSGAFTPTEIVDTISAGADIVKLFPAEFLGPAYVKTVLAPLAGTPIAPAGGVTEQNVGDWFAAGACAVGVGSAITKAARPDGDYAQVRRATERFLAAVAAARG